MKKCSECDVEKSLDCFSVNSSGLHGRYSICKDCRRERRRRNLDYVHKYLLDHPCVDCGESDPIVLDFDHVRGEKKENVSKRVRVSLEAVILEIAKCEVRCANCHRRKTARQFGYYRASIEL